MPRATGRVVNVTTRGDLLLDISSEIDPRQFMGGFVVDPRHQGVAKVRDVIGPVSTPYVVASPRRDVDPRRLVGRDLFLEPARKGGGRGGRKGGPGQHGPREQRPQGGAGRGGSWSPGRGGSSREQGRPQGGRGRGGEPRRRGGGAR